MQTSLPQLSGDRLFLTDGGLETTLVFHQGIDLPQFASFPLLEQEPGRAALREYFEGFLELARERDAGFVLDTADLARQPRLGARSSATTPARSTASTATRSRSRRRSATSTAGTDARSLVNGVDRPARRRLRGRRR